MEISYSQFEERAGKLNSRIRAACGDCGRNPDEIDVVAVTKSHPVEAIEYAVRYGFRRIGENRVQEADQKRKEIDPRIELELIGHLQTNKARLAVSLFNRIQSVDRIKLVKVLNRYCEELGKSLSVLLQVNSGEDPRKFGVSREEAPKLMEVAQVVPHLEIEGLMTIAPLSREKDVARLAFDRLRELRDRLAERSGLPLKVLSMGMTSDMETAIQSGSTCIRVGTALFGAR